MEGYLRIGLLVVAAVILVLMIYESRYRRKIIKAIESTPEPYVDTVFNKETDNEFMEVEIEANPKLVSIPKPAAVVAKKPEPVSHVQDILAISIVAKSGQRFSSYDLLQAIAAAGLKYGDMNIFHYYSSSPVGKKTLFSLASMTKPGTFDLDNVDHINCIGLTLFMNMPAVPNAAQALELMIKSAQQLADDLDGELRAGQKEVWNDNTVKQYRQKTLKYA